MKHTGLAGKVLEYAVAGTLAVGAMYAIGGCEQPNKEEPQYQAMQRIRPGTPEDDLKHVRTYKEETGRDKDTSILDIIEAIGSAPGAVPGK